MSIIHLIGALVALVLAFWFGRTYYHSSQTLGVIGVIIASFLAAYRGLRGMGYAPLFNLTTGFITSGIIAVASLLLGSCRCEYTKKTCKTKTCDTWHNKDREITTATTKKRASYASASASVETPSAGSTTTDDLKKIEGIWPVLEKHLHSHGVRTFVDVADATPDFLKDILSHEGKFAIHNPESWPEQALLCAQGKWKKLEKLQEKLKGGRKA